MARLSFDSETLAVAEERLFALLWAFVDYRYDVNRTYYPWALPGVRVPLAPPRLNNCCTFVEALLVKVFSEAHGAAFSWDMRRACGRSSGTVGRRRRCSATWGLSSHSQPTRA